MSARIVSWSLIRWPFPCDFAQAERLRCAGLLLKSLAEGSFDQFPKSETVGVCVFFYLGEQGIRNLHRGFHNPSLLYRWSMNMGVWAQVIARANWPGARSLR